MSTYGARSVLVSCALHSAMVLCLCQPAMSIVCHLSCSSCNVYVLSIATDNFAEHVFSIYGKRCSSEHRLCTEINYSKTAHCNPLGTMLWLTCSHLFTLHPKTHLEAYHALRSPTLVLLKFCFISAAWCLFPLQCSRFTALYHTCLHIRQTVPHIRCSLSALYSTTHCRCHRSNSDIIATTWHYCSYNVGMTDIVDTTAILRSIGHYAGY